MTSEPASGATASGRPDLTEGPITRTLLMFALPTLGANVLQSLNGSINAVWVGRFLGENAIAATSNANIIMFLMFALGFGFGMAATVIIGQAIGARDIDTARRTVGTALGLFTMISVAIALLGWFSAPALLRLLATPPGVTPLALAYLRVIFLGLPPMFLGLLLNTALRGAGDAVTPLRSMIVSVVLDAGLNPLLIAGIGPFPRMGIAGAATATLIANYCVMFGLIAYIYAKDLPIRLRGAEFAYLKPSGAIFRTILVKGLPMGLQMLVMTLSGVLMIGFVNREGVDTTAAFGIAQQLWTYLQMPAMAIGAAVSTMAAQNIGADRWDRIDRITNTGLVANTVMTTLGAVLMVAFDRPAFALFIGWDSPVIAIARHAQMLAIWSFILFGLAIVYFSTIRANGAVMVPLLILVVCNIGVRVAAVIGLHPLIGADALWLAFPISTGATALCGAVYYRYGGWRKARMLAPPCAAELRDEAAADMMPGARLHPTAEG